MPVKIKLLFSLLFSFLKDSKLSLHFYKMALSIHMMTFYWMYYFLNNVSVRYLDTSNYLNSSLVRTTVYNIKRYFCEIDENNN